MKILSYNINGIKSFSKDGPNCEEIYKGSPLQNDSKLCHLVRDFNDIDVYCFQEVKADNVDNILYQKPDYVSYLATNDKKKGYAGVLSWVNNKHTRGDNSAERNQIVDVTEKVLCEDSVYAGGRIVNIEFEYFHLINVYVPNSGNKEEFRKQWDQEFCEYLQSLTKPLIVCGDFNVCSTSDDYWGNWEKAKDTAPGLMTFEIKAHQNLARKCDLLDAYRYMHINENKYSWYSTRNKSAVEKNHGWRIDYFLITSSLRHKVKICDVMQGYQAPDHSPIILDIDI